MKEGTTNIVVKQVVKAIEGEIKWCKEQPEEVSPSKDFRRGFVEGLRQAKRITKDL